MGISFWGGPPGKAKRKTGAGLVEHLEFDFGRSHVISANFRAAPGPAFRLAREHDFALIQRDRRAIDVSLGIRPEVEREPAILFIIGCVKRS